MQQPCASETTSVVIRTQFQQAAGVHMRPGETVPAGAAGQLHAAGQTHEPLPLRCNLGIHGLGLGPQIQQAATAGTGDVQQAGLHQQALQHGLVLGTVEGADESGSELAGNMATCRSVQQVQQRGPVAMQLISL